MKDFAINSLWVLVGVTASGLSGLLIASFTLQIVKIFKNKK